MVSCDYQGGYMSKVSKLSVNKSYQFNKPLEEILIKGNEKDSSVQELLTELTKKLGTIFYEK
ncbi:hypothetical protein SM124_09090 [Bacillus sp. 31A1R]|uniref:Uncharacterized protein n=1 Tax=Robertmurraya mangrovi TaxID=3098077 RepID=A0ABU5IXR0_9BACI|nr:hypothetical protein [Bacillus sp. 31A1R]MDZ5471901.1 hypothetical protein [Bacillus sp. 31A1R]